MNSKRLVGIVILGLCILGIGMFAMSSTQAHDEKGLSANDSVPTRRQLRQRFFQDRAVLVVYGATDTVLSRQYRTLLEELDTSPEPDSWRNIAVSHKTVAEVTENDLKGKVLFLVGTQEAMPLLKEFSAQIPLDFRKDAFSFNAKEFADPDAHLSVGFYPNPKNDTLPVSLLSGNNEQHVFRVFEQKVQDYGRLFFRQNMDYEIYQGNSRMVMGNFGADWRIDTTANFDFSKGNTPVHSSKHFDFVSYQDAITTQQAIPLAMEIERTVAAILDFAGNNVQLPKMRYHIYKSAEEKGLIADNTDQAHFDSVSGSVHTIINEKYLDNFIEKENTLIIHRLLGASKTVALTRGLPIYFTDKWQREGYRYWAARLFESGNVLPLKELLDKAVLEIESPLITDCLSATLVGFLLETWGKDTFLKRYASWTPTNREIQNLMPAWQRYLLKNATAHPKKERKVPALSYLKGFNFAHEGYSIYNGYGGTKATQALQKMKTLGSNAMALVPYSYIEDKNSPIPFRFSDHPGAENDEALVHSVYEARKMGIGTLLKPQIFAGDSWPGDVEMLNKEDWDAFFEYYYRWIRHYAFLAEIHEMEALCVGVEFAKATLSHEAEWRKMFRGIRGLYQGQLTYAANWGAEFEQVGFWDELDFIGLNCYYPLSKEEAPTKAALKANFEKVKTKITKVYDKFKKPIVFTEIGFRSIDQPWKSPHAAGDDSFNARHQQLCYEVVFEGIENAVWCEGILWWKFPSYLEYRGEENSAFTPNKKRAEETVRAWFSK